MSTPEIDQVLAQMRDHPRAGHRCRTAARTTGPERLRRAAAAFDRLGQRHPAKGQRDAYVLRAGRRGLDLAEVMVAMQKSSLSFQAMVEVRNKLIEAYKDIKNMPV
jgi:flagellar hook-basal body complex protein FliE